MQYHVMNSFMCLLMMLKNNSFNLQKIKFSIISSSCRCKLLFDWCSLFSSLFSNQAESLKKHVTSLHGACQKSVKNKFREWRKKMAASTLGALKVIICRKYHICTKHQIGKVLKAWYIDKSNHKVMQDLNQLLLVFSRTKHALWEPNLTENTECINRFLYCITLWSKVKWF